MKKLLTYILTLLRKEYSMFTKEQLGKIMPTLVEPKLSEYYTHLRTAMEEHKINTVPRMTAFLAQLAHESADLKYMEEIGTGERYEGRRDLGNIYSGDGKRFKGRGPIQLTGRNNYKIFGDLLNVDLLNLPELAALPEYGFKIAAAYWTSRKLNTIADIGDFKEITRRINGGYNGLSDRVRRHELAKQILGG